MPRSASTPAWRMPAEWEKHERTWMAWPSGGYALGETPEEHDEARGAWASVANAVVRFEPVTMIVDPADVKVAREWLDPQVDIIAAPLNDAWMRDIGPTFVRSTEDGCVAAVDWVFNGWGAQSWSEFDKDAAIAKFIAKKAGVPAVRSDMVNEGGGIHTDGKSTVLITETVQLDPDRNPGWTKETVEAELRRTLGVKDVVWFARGLTRDYEEFGTRGHIDIVSCFADANTVLFHDQRNVEHPDYWISQEARRVLKAVARSRAKDKPNAPKLKVVSVPAPDAIEDDHGWNDYSYINHYVCNGAVILCAFDDPGDARAKRVLQRVDPGREIVLVDARAIFARGGGIHCITQQQPVARPKRPRA